MKFLAALFVFLSSFVSQRDGRGFQRGFIERQRRAIEATKVERVVGE